VSSGAQSTAATATGSAIPFRIRSPSGVNPCARRGATSALVTSLTRIWPPPAAAHSRAAITTGTPNQRPSSLTSGSPVWMPTRTPSASASGWRVLWRAACCCTTTPQATASTALAKVIIRPSPVWSTTWP